MYESPIDVLIEDVRMQIVESVDEKVYQAVVNVGISVEKEELLRALQYDRQQYEAGYADGVADAVKHGKWEHLGGDEWCCSACGNVITTEGSWEKPTKKYCEECGAKMAGGEAFDENDHCDC